MNKPESSSTSKRAARDRDLDFEIEFYEKLLREKPDFVEVLISLADAYTRRGHYPSGLEHDRTLARLRPDDSTIRHNLACSYVLTGQVDEAFSTLRKAIELGYDDLPQLERDPHLEPLRSDARFRELTLRLKELKRQRRRLS